MKAKFILTTLIICNFNLVSCNNTQSQKYSISIDNTYLGINEYLQIHIFINNNEITNYNLFTFESSNSDIATVSKAGIIKGISLGDVTIKTFLKGANKELSTLDLTVGESLNVQQVFNRFKKANNYTISYEGNLILDDEIKFKNIEKITKNNYYFSTNSEKIFRNYGVSTSNSTVFEYTIKDSKIVNPTYNRRDFTTLNKFIYTFQESGNYYDNLALSKDNKYNLTNTKDTDLFNKLLFQNILEDKQSLIQFMLNNSSPTISLEILNSEEFNLSISFNDSNYVTMKFYNLNNTSIDEFKTFNYQDINYPDPYQDIQNIDNYISNYNYSYDLGETVTSDNKNIQIGTINYTSDYIYYDYSDEYLTELRKENKDSYRHGFINLKDSVYKFNIDDSNNITILDKYITDNSETFDKYYDFILTPTYVYNYLKNINKLYSFINYDSGMLTSFNEYCSLSKEAITLASEINTEASDYSVESLGIAFGINYSGEEIKIAYSPLVSFNGIAIPSKYKTYYNFNKSNIAILDTYLNSAK